MILTAVSILGSSTKQGEHKTIKLHHMQNAAWLRPSRGINSRYMDIASAKRFLHNHPGVDRIWPLNQP